MNEGTIDLVPPVILGTSESYRGDIVRNVNGILVPLFCVCLLDYPDVGRISYVDKCVFVSDAVIKYLEPGEFMALQKNDGYSYVLGGISLGVYSGGGSHDEIELIASGAKLVLS